MLQFQLWVFVIFRSLLLALCVLTISVTVVCYSFFQISTTRIKIASVQAGSVIVVILLADSMPTEQSNSTFIDEQQSRMASLASDVASLAQSNVSGAVRCDSFFLPDTGIACFGCPFFKNDASFEHQFFFVSKFGHTNV